MAVVHDNQMNRVARHRKQIIITIILFVIFVLDAWYLFTAKGADGTLFYIQLGIVLVVGYICANTFLGNLTKIREEKRFAKACDKVVEQFSRLPDNVDIFRGLTVPDGLHPKFKKCYTNGITIVGSSKICQLIVSDMKGYLSEHGVAADLRQFQEISARNQRMRDIDNGLFMSVVHSITGTEKLKESDLEKYPQADGMIKRQRGTENISTPEPIKMRLADKLSREEKDIEVSNPMLLAKNEARSLGLYIAQLLNLPKYSIELRPIVYFNNEAGVQFSANYESYTSRFMCDEFGMMQAFVQSPNLAQEFTVDQREKIIQSFSRMIEGKK